MWLLSYQTLAQSGFPVGEGSGKNQGSLAPMSGEDLYVAYGQTAAGRYLVVFFILKYQTAALPISAREMTQAERRYYVQ